MKLEIYRQIVETYSNIKFNENPSSGSRVVPCGRTDMTKLIVDFLNFAKRVYKRISVTGRSGTMNSAAVIFLAVTATKICINPRYL